MSFSVSRLPSTVRLGIPRGSTTLVGFEIDSAAVHCRTTQISSNLNTDQSGFNSNFIETTSQCGESAVQLPYLPPTIKFLHDLPRHAG